ncbi:methylmalonyl-CoA mutase subunit beta [Afipia clevelandensis]|uniref:methylmalonyl-CoA mutase n=1 Tax=Afipia clevelandensis ATCC 49720 TaxID=883079 RepID=K8PTA4_9BRAD|nr:methylmalonyl-CoA mutase subunit beta [Afipia clevelandensis]EKS42760.1 methylmalonyl-CoA mutase, small subunit [Afipia clevelandensis ATCC 49720]
MSTETDTLPLASEFPSASRDDWRKLADGVLKGTPFERLVGKTYDGLRIDPIYERARNAVAIPARAAGAPWAIMQRVDHPDAAIANAQALHDLENGATGLTVVFAGANAARGYGLPPTKDALKRALDGVYLDAGIDIELEIGPQSRDMGEHLAELLAERHITPSAVKVRFGLDPIGGGGVRGSSHGPWESIAKVFGGKITQLAKLGFRGPFAPADGRVIHDAGGSEAQELAYVLAVGVAYLRALADAGIPLENARRMIYARLSADADQFLTMAKFRALRLLWARIEQSCGLTPEPLFVVAETSWRMLTQRDPDVNMLRATIAAFSAGLGGANSVSVLPHTLALGLPDAFARRIARNTQLVLLEESNLDKVSDPAAGSGGIETLTKQLCEAAWSLFQEIEKAGGAFAALEKNIIQPKVAAVRAARDTNIARRKDVLTGASEFPNLNEKKPAVLDAKPAALPWTDEVVLTFDALAPIRLGAPFEELRDRSDAMLAKSGKRPAVFLANLGTPADFTARATFTKSFFETGGIEALGNDGFSDPGTLAAAFKTSGAKLVCLCSSDKVYGAQAVAAAQALHAAGAKHIYLAGRPGDLEPALREAGVTGFIAAGGDALATLKAAYQML